MERTDEIQTYRTVSVAAITALHCASAGFVNGNELYEMCSKQSTAAVQCVGYVEGIADADETSARISDWRWCMPAKVAAGQLVDVVVQYIFSHPSIWELNAAPLVVAAFSKCVALRC
jgi:hypothetical protein